MLWSSHLSVVDVAGAGLSVGLAEWSVGVKSCVLGLGFSDQVCLS